MTLIASGPSASRAKHIADAFSEASTALATAQKKMAEAAKLAEDDYADNAAHPADLAGALRIVAGQITVEGMRWADFADARKTR
jgi:hypothetical protein